MEKYFIHKYNSFKNGYNSTLGGDGVYGLSGALNHFYGKSHSVQTKRIMGNKSKERNAIKSTHTEEAIRNRVLNRNKRMADKRYTDKEKEQYKKLSMDKKGCAFSDSAMKKRKETIEEKKEKKILISGKLFLLMT